MAIRLRARSEALLSMLRKPCVGPASDFGRALRMVNAVANAVGVRLQIAGKTLEPLRRSVARTAGCVFIHVVRIHYVAQVAPDAALAALPPRPATESARACRRCGSRAIPAPASSID